jgi:hypothetical protein
MQANWRILNRRSRQKKDWKSGGVDDFDDKTVHRRMFAFYEREFPFAEELVSAYIFSLIKASLKEQRCKQVARRIKRSYR